MTRDMTMAEYSQALQDRGIDLLKVEYGKNEELAGWFCYTKKFVVFGADLADALVGVLLQWDDEKPKLQMVEEDKWIKMEREHNRIKEGEFSGLESHPDGRTCGDCGVERIASIFLHRHVCPDIPEHRENYNTDFLERNLLG